MVRAISHAMLIQKIFHVRLNLLETKARLAKLHWDRRALQNVQVAILDDDAGAHIELTPANGFHARVKLRTLPSDDPCQTLFRSTGGDMEIAGLLEFVPIRENFTEVQLTIDYEIKSPIHRFLDALTACVDGFLNAQLRRIEAQLAGHVSVADRGEQFLSEPQLVA
jgi:hypothetical protein